MYLCTVIYSIFSMIILNIETSTDACSAAITAGGKVLEVGGEALACLHSEKSEHARELALMADSLVQRAQESGYAIDAVAVSAGPGSYTGLRIGASAAKGIAYGMNVPLLAIPTLQIMAASALAQGAEGLLCPMIDARRMEVYNALYDTLLTESSPAQATILTEDSFAEQLQQGIVTFFGNGSDKFQPIMTHPNARFISGIVPDAAFMGALAETAFANKAFADVAYWTPFYLKDFEAKISTVKGLK